MTNYLFSTGHCPMCVHLKNELKKKGLIDLVTPVDCETEEGEEPVARYGVRHTPTLVVVDGDRANSITKSPEIVVELTRIREINNA